MKKNLNTTETTQPTMTAETINAIVEAISDINNIYAIAENAVKNNMPEDDFVKLVCAAFFNQSSDLECLRNIQKIQDDAHICYKNVETRIKAEEIARAEEEAIKIYQGLNIADRIILNITETMIAYNNSEIAKTIQNMVKENSSSIKVAALIGAISDDAEMMAQIYFIYDSIKREKELNRFSNTFVRVVEELCKK